MFGKCFFVLATMHPKIVSTNAEASGWGRLSPNYTLYQYSLHSQIVCTSLPPSMNYRKASALLIWCGRRTKEGERQRRNRLFKLFVANRSRSSALFASVSDCRSRSSIFEAAAARAREKERERVAFLKSVAAVSGFLRLSSISSNVL